VSGIFSFLIPSEGRINAQISLEKCGVYENFQPILPISQLAPHFKILSNPAKCYLIVKKVVREVKGL